MAGNVKVGGNVIATHTGVEGAGTVTLSNVTASALKMSSSGNTITDSAGNAVLSESSGTVNINKGTVGSNVVFPAGHVIQTITDEHLGINNPGNNPITVSVQGDMQAELGSLLECKITPIATSNKLIIHCFISGVYNQNQNTAGLHAGFAIGSFNSSGVGTTLGPRDIVTSHEGYSSVITLDSMMYMLIAPPPSAGSEITIRPTFAAVNGSMYILANPSQDCAYMTVQEIQQ